MLYMPSFTCLYNSIMEEQPQDQELHLLVHLPSAIRIRQRLGQLSLDGTAFQKKVIAPLANLGGQKVSGEELLGHIAVNLGEYAEAHLLGMTGLAYTRLPAIIHELTKDDPDREADTLALWEKMVIAKKEKDEVETQRIKAYYLEPKHKLSRKAKKEDRRTERHNRRPQRQRGL